MKYILSKKNIIILLVLVFTLSSIITVSAVSILAPSTPRSNETSDNFINSSEESDGSNIQIKVDFTNSTNDANAGASTGDVIYLLNGTSPNIINFTTPITHTLTVGERNAATYNFTVTKALLGGVDGPFEIHSQINNGTAGAITATGLSFTLDTILPTFTASVLNDTAVTVSFSELVDGTLIISNWELGGVTVSGASPSGVLNDVSSIIMTITSSLPCDPTVTYNDGANIRDNALNQMAISTVTASGFACPTTSGGGSGSSGTASAPSFEPPTIIDPLSPYSPLSLDGRQFLITSGDFVVDYTTDSTVNLAELDPVTNIIPIGQSVELKFRIYSPLGSEHIAHASLYADLINGPLGTSDETVISYDKNIGKTLQDKSNLYSSTDVRLIEDGEFVNVIFDVTFARSLAISDIYLKIWDENNYALYQQINDFWKVEGVAKPSHFSEVYEKAYAGLETKIFPAVSPPIIENYDDVDKPIKVTVANQDSSLYQLVNAANPEEYAAKTGLEYEDGKVRILVVLEEYSREIVNQIKDIANVESANQKFVQVIIPLENLAELYDLPIKKVQPPSKPIQNSLISEGFDFINTAKAHDINLEGNGIKIAVLDLAFDVTNSEISDRIVDKKSFRHDFDGSSIPLSGYGHEYVHGTAVAEIVTDVAPKSELFLYTFASEVEFLNAMDYAMKNKVDMITMSAGWVNYPTDGSSEMVQKIEQAISQGIPFVVSAGNYAETHWEGNFVDVNNNGWQEFSGTDEGLSVYADSFRVTQQFPFVLYLMWDSPTGKTYDFDMTLTDENGREVAYSSNLQESINDIYFEYVVFTPESPGSYSLGISYDGTGKPDAILEVFSPNDLFEYPVSSGSVSVPTDADGIISVGALNYFDASLEPFSSQGPTNNCKQVPSVMGPDAVTTLAYEQIPFYGTSAASPHVAGLVALILEKIPDITPSEILYLLTENADKDLVSITESNNVYGFGAAKIDFLIESIDISSFEEQFLSDCTPSSLQSGDRDGILTQQSFEKKIHIPDWVKHNAGWWSAEQIDDVTFGKALQFLIREKILIIPIDKSDETQEIVVIPEWVRSNAKWWSESQIDDGTFAKAIEYLIKNGILTV